MNFKKWRMKTKEASEYCTEHRGDGINSYRRMDCEECIWEAAQDEAWDRLEKCKYCGKQKPNRCRFCSDKLYGDAKSEARKEMAKEILPLIKILPERNLSNVKSRLVEQLEKEAKG
jgi:hypothetical protein